MDAIKTVHFRLCEAYKYYSSVESSGIGNEGDVEVSQWMENACKTLCNVHYITDEELMSCFCSGLFSTPEVLFSICQQWESMIGYIMIPHQLQGDGRIWTCFLHLLLCDGNLSVEMIPMFQSYQSMIYLFGTSSCAILQNLFDEGLFEGTCLGTNVVPIDKRVISPAFLRFDARMMLTVCGRAVLCMLRRRGVFTHNTFRCGTVDISYQSKLREPLEYIFNTSVNIFRPCIVACMLISLVWSASRRPVVLFMNRMKEAIASFLVHIEDVIIPYLSNIMDRNEEWIFKAISRLSLFKKIIILYTEANEENGYSMETLVVMYNDIWNEIN